MRFNEQETSLAFERVNRGIQAYVDGDLHSSWEKFKARFVYYDEMQNQPGFEKFAQLQDWPNRRGFKKNIEKMELAFGALSEIPSLSVDNEVREKMKNLLMAKIKIKIAEFEVTQLRYLKKIQWEQRDEINALNDSLMLQRKKYQEDLANMEKVKFDTAPYWNQFISMEKNKFHLTKKILFAEQASMGASFSSRTLHLIALLVKGLHSVVSSLTVIPIVSAIITAVVLIGSAIRTWAKDKSKAQKGMAALLAVVGVVLLINVGLATVATGGLVAALITIGVIKNTVLPWIKVRGQVKEREKELVQIEERMNDLEAGIYNPELTQFEKHILLKKLEEQYVTATPAERNEINKSRGIILAGNNIYALITDSYINKICGDSVPDFLLNANKARMESIKADLVPLKQKESDKEWEMANGALAIAGAILVCIPTPPTLILGCALLVTNSVIGIAMHFSLGTKLRNLASRLWDKAKAVLRKLSEEDVINSHENTLVAEKKAEPVNPHESTLDLRQSLEISATNEVESSTVKINKIQVTSEPVNDKKFTSKPLSILGALFGQTESKKEVEEVAKDKERDSFRRE